MRTVIFNFTSFIGYLLSNTFYTVCCKFPFFKMYTLFQVNSFGWNLACVNKLSFSLSDVLSGEGWQAMHETWQFGQVYKKSIHPVFIDFSWENNVMKFKLTTNCHVPLFIPSFVFLVGIFSSFHVFQCTHSITFCSFDASLQITALNCINGNMSCKAETRGNTVKLESQ